MGGTTDEFSPMTFEYDARGRWISETRDGKVVARCTYRGDTEVLDHCELSWSLNVVRDSRGRIAAVITRGGERRDEVAWDVAGRVVAIGRHAYDYDAQGRMRSDRGLVLEYDARNRVTRKTFPGADETDAIVYTYDGDHLVRVKGPKYDNLSIAYDARGRVHEAERSGLETSHVRTYDYDCR